MAKKGKRYKPRVRLPNAPPTRVHKRKGSKTTRKTIGPIPSKHEKDCGCFVCTWDDDPEERY